MYIFLRLTWTILRAFFVPRIGPKDLVRTPVRIYPNDLDINFHLNNGRYLTLFDLGRLDMTTRSGLWRVMVKKGWLPVLSTAAIRFRKSVHAFAKMEITTQIIYADEKWFYIEHRLMKGAEVYARALVKGLFRAKDGEKIATTKLMEAVGVTAGPMVEPELVTKWRAFESELNKG